MFRGHIWLIKTRFKFFNSEIKIILKSDFIFKQLFLDGLQSTFMILAP